MNIFLLFICFNFRIKVLVTVVNSLRSYWWPLIYFPRTNNLIFSYNGSSARCVCVKVEEACGCRQIRQTEVGVSLGCGSRCSLKLSRHETQIFRSRPPHETPGRLWRTSAEYSLINHRKLMGGGGGGGRELQGTERHTERSKNGSAAEDPYDFVLFEIQRRHCD